MHIKINDVVELRSGADKGTRGKVLAVDREAGKVTVESVALVYKHVRPSRRNPQGGRLSKEMPVQLSSVMLVCEACDAATRTGVRYADDGSKHRYCKKCGAAIGQIAPPRARYAKV